MSLSPDIRYRWKLLRAGPLRLDGGGMFGCIPRIVWSRSVPSDEKGRITVGHNCLLLDRVGPADAPGPRKIVIETGSGDKFDAKMKAIFGLGDENIETALVAAGSRCQDVDLVIVSHLHFDHAGGLTRLVRPGETPDWMPPPDAGIPAVKRTFPRASIIAQKQEWEDALPNNSVMTRTYLREHLEPLREHLKLVESPPPFAPGHHPRRDEMPPGRLADRKTEVAPNIWVFLVPGHTWGQQAIEFTDERGSRVVFTPDVMPTVHHLGPAYSLAYDVEPYISMLSRRWFLQAAVENNWHLLLDHEPGNPSQRATPDGRGWFDLSPIEMP